MKPRARASGAARKAPVHEASIPGFVRVPQRRLLGPPDDGPAAGRTQQQPPSNYKVEVIVGKRHETMVRLTATLDTGAGSNFVRTGVLPADADIKPAGSRWRFVDANGRPLHIGGIASLTIRLGSLAIPVDFLIVNSLSASMILGCAFIDTHVKAIRPQSRQVTFMDGSSVPIRSTSLLGMPLKPPPFSPLDPRIRISRWIVLPAGKSLYVTVRSLVSGIAVLRSLLDKDGPASNVRIHKQSEDVRAGKDFNVKVTNRADKPFNLSKDTILGWVQRNVVR